MINLDSYKFPGAVKLALSGTASENGAISMSIRGSIVTVSGLPFEKGMLSVTREQGGEGYGVPAGSESGFFTYNLDTKQTSTAAQKQQGGYEDE